MSAIAAAAWDHLGGAAGAAVRRLLSAMPERGATVPSIVDFESTAVGCAAGRIPIPGALAPAVARVASLAVVLDGRIDNRADLLARASLGDEGQDDARMIAEVLARLGDDALALLEGDYALIAWDAAKGRLLAARDVFGLRPLHYCRSGEGWLVASEFRALATQAGAAIDEGYLGELLAGRPTSLTATPLRAVHRVPPGCVVTLAPGQATTTRVVVMGGDDVDDRPPPDLHEEFLHVLGDAVSRRLRSAARVGVMLSGGLDSTSVYLTARALDGGMDAWTVEQRPASSETAAASATVALAGGRHRLAPSSASLFDYAAAARDWLEPPPHPAAANTAGLRRLAAAAGVPVLLNGLGGDEFFGVNHWHAADVLVSGRVDRVLRFWRMRRRSSSPPSLTTLVRAAIAPLVPNWARPLARRVAGTAAPPWVAPDFARRVGLVDRLRMRVDLPGRSIAERARLAEVFSGPSIFANEEADRLAVLTGTEDRAPYFDRRLAAFALRLPPALVDAAPSPKAFVREALGSRLPAHLQRVAPSPSFAYLHADALGQLGGARFFGRVRLVEAGWVDRAFLRRAVEGTWRRDGTILESSPFVAGLWSIASAELCFRAVADARPSPTHEEPMASHAV